MTDKKPDKDTRKEIVIDLGGSFHSSTARNRTNTQDTAEESLKKFDPDNLPPEMQQGLSPDSAQVEVHSEYDGRHEFLRKASTQVPADPFTYGIDGDELAEPTYNLA